MMSIAPVSNNLAAIVLAAGASSRMSRLKPLLDLAGRTALERAISLFRDAGLEDVLVVLGNRGGELRPLAERCGARCVHNAHWEQGMYSSVAAGAGALGSFTRAAFILPADVPLVRASTVRQLAAAFDNRADRILYPVFDQRRGHPPLISRSILEQAARSASGPLRTLLLAHEQSADDIPVADEAIHLDMDTPADFNTLQSLAARRDVPTAAECEVLLTNHQTPESVIRHSQKVAEVARRIVNVLLAAGVSINPDLVCAAALLHDLCKGQAKHAEAAAAALQAHGMARVAEIVNAHTEMAFDGTIEERAIVYLADKLVSADRLVSLDERFRRSLDRFRDHPNALAAARRRKATAEQIAAALENHLGMPLIAILTDDASLTISAPEATV